MVLTRDPLDSKVQAEVIQRLSGSGITLRVARWYQILEVALGRQRQLGGHSPHSIFFSEFTAFFRRYYDMGVYDAEVMVQDEDPRNAPIYFDDYMYVGGRRWSKMPLYFAPYLTKSCVYYAALPQITTAGISFVSKVEDVRQMGLDDLRTDPHKAVDPEIKQMRNWKRWRHGLADIRLLALEKKWDADSVWLYFLSEPVALGRTIKKPKGLTRLAPGCKTTFLDLLKNDVLRIGS